MKIITALNNEKINEKIAQTNKFEIICKDIQYQEALLEIIDESIDILILSNLLPGELNIYELINLIKYKTEKTRIFIILDEQNDNIIKFLIKKGINDIFINNKITVENLIEKIENKEENREKIKELKSHENNVFYNIKNKYTNKSVKNNKKAKKICIIGSPKVGKTCFMILISLYMNNKKSLLINFKKNDLNIIFGKKINKEIQKFNSNIDFICEYDNEKLDEKKIQKYDYIFFEIGNIEEKINIIKNSNYIILLLEPNLIGLKEISIIIEKLVKNIKIEKEKIMILYNKINLFSINKQILNQIFSDFKILGNIKNNIYYNLFINKNLKIENLKIRKEYKKIIEKLEKIEGEN